MRRRLDGGTSTLILAYYWGFYSLGIRWLHLKSAFVLFVMHATPESRRIGVSTSWVLLIGVNPGAPKGDIMPNSVDDILLVAVLEPGGA